MTFVPPIDGDLHVTSPFGDRISPITGKPSFHSGVDLRAAVGTPVRASLPGTVERSFHSDSAGNVVTLAYDDGRNAQYFHLDERLVQKGDTVAGGDVVGLAGATGNVTGPHLHWELRNAAGDLVNPMSALAGDAVLLVALALGAMAIG